MAVVTEQEKQEIRIPEIRDYADGYAETEDYHEGGSAVAEAPYDAEIDASSGDTSIDVDIEDMVWEVDTEPAENGHADAYGGEMHRAYAGEHERTANTRSMADADYSYDAPYDEIDAGTGDYYSDSDENYQEAYYDGRPDEYEEVPYARKINKHVFTWVMSVVCGIYGVDRMVRGQIGLGVLKLLTAGGLGFWYLADAGIAIYRSYMAPDANDHEDLHFDRWGRYV